MTSLSLNDLYRVASSPTDEPNLLNAQFVRRELPIRYAHRCAQLRNLPFGLAADERIEHAARTYEQQAEALLEQGRRLEELEKRVSALMRRFEDGPREETGSGPGPE